MTSFIPRCKDCGAVVAETSRTVAKRETMAPELVTVCPSCNTLAVCAFYPAVAEPVAP